MREPSSPVARRKPYNLWVGVGRSRSIGRTCMRCLILAAFGGIAVPIGGPLISQISDPAATHAYTKKMGATSDVDRSKLIDGSRGLKRRPSSSIGTGSGYHLTDVAGGV